MAYITKDKHGLVQLWNNKPEFNVYGDCWQAWIKRGEISEVPTKVNNFTNNVTFEESPKFIDFE